jgi:rubredoxin/flavin reductase (DIM6/NTAB) family NADH-FMN oxidoreductase RutF
MNPQALYKISYGLYVLGAQNNGRLNGCIINTLFQLTSLPPMLGISVNKGNLTNLYIRESGTFTASVLSTEIPTEIIGRFGFKSGKTIDKFSGLNYKITNSGNPVLLSGTVGFFECNVVNSVELSTHTLFIAELVDAELFNDKISLTYDYYRSVKKGTSPKTAPTFIDIKNTTNIKQEVNIMEKYVCNICGYVYDPETGDPDSGISAGTPFESLPEDWVCPLCGAGKDEFEKEA